MRKNRRYIKWIIAIAIIFFFSIIIIYSIKNEQGKKIDTMSLQEEKIITEYDVINFAKEKIKNKLQYPETAVFSKEKISYQDEKYIVECYCTSKNKNKQETKVKFVTIIQNDNKTLQCIDMMTNGETCTRDAKETVEELIKQKEYKQIFDDWFNSIEQITMDYEKFTNYLNEYPVNLEKATFEEKEYNENKKIELYIKEEGNRNIWYFEFLNGQVYNFDIILKYDW